jgi:hypothetical protein
MALNSHWPVGLALFALPTKNYGSEARAAFSSRHCRRAVMGERAIRGGMIDRCLTMDFHIRCSRQAGCSTCVILCSIAPSSSRLLNSSYHSQTRTNLFPPFSVPQCNKRYCIIDLDEDKSRGSLGHYWAILQKSRCLHNK